MPWVTVAHPCRRCCDLLCAEAATADELAHDELVREVVVAPALKDLEAAYGQNDFADKVCLLSLLPPPLPCVGMLLHE